MLINLTRPDGSTTQVESTQTILRHSLNAAGRYLGLLPEGDSNAAGVVDLAPPDDRDWRWVEERWQRTVPLIEIKLKRWEEIKDDRRNAINAPLTTPYGVFDNDEAARISISQAAQLASALLAAGQSGTIDFTLADNSVVALTYQQMIEVGLLMGAKVQQIFSTGRALRTSIEDAANATEVAAVVWPSS